MAEAYEAYRAGRLDAFYAPLVVDDEALEAGLADGTYAIDTRLRDALRVLGFGAVDGAAGSRSGGRLARQSRTRRSSPPSTRRSARPISAPRFGARIDDLEARLGRLERGPAARAPPRSPEACVRERAPAPAPGVRADTAGRRSSSSRLALGVFWLQALGWPMAKGRDTWDYLVYYLQLLDSEPPLSQVQLFRAPLTPLVVGLPMDLGGSVLLEVVFGVLFAVLGRRVERDGAHVRPDSGARLRSAAPRVSGLGDALPPGLERRGLRDGARAVGTRPRADAATAHHAAASSRSAPASRRSALIRPANQVLLPAVLVPLLAVAPWRRRLTWVAACFAAAVLPLAGWAVHNGDPLRRPHRHPRR